MHNLKFAAELHDIGKIAIKEAIIDKSSKLTEEEYETVKKHPELGVEILQPIRFLKPVLPIILHHHERYDGTGYPNGMSRGDDPPGGPDPQSGGRLRRHDDPAAVQQADDAHRRRLELCRKEGGASFDPECVDALIRFLESEEETMLLSAKVQIGSRIVAAAAPRPEDSARLGNPTCELSARLSAIHRDVALDRGLPSALR